LNIPEESVRKVIDADYMVAALEKYAEEIRSNKTSDARDNNMSRSPHIQLFKKAVKCKTIIISNSAINLNAPNPSAIPPPAHQPGSEKPQCKQIPLMLSHYAAWE
jgi:hypothetical protein